MDKLESLKILRGLANGIDPYTGEVLPEQSPYQHPQTVRALFYAVVALERMKEGEPGANAGPVNAGKPWERTEDDQLGVEFDNGMSIKELAHKHQRTVGAIQSRLIRLGKLTYMQWLHPTTPDKHT